jgi:glycine oxidase
MPGEILIVGQGVAGTVLAWEFERAGLAFRIADAGHAQAASVVAAGIINPITGQRIVKSWRLDTLRPLAREVYGSLEKELGIPLWREMRVRRFYLKEDERRILAEKQAKGDLGDYAGTTDGEGFWIEGAAHVDVPALIAAARKRWLAAGLLREERVDFFAARREYELVIDCSGAVGGPFNFVGWQYSKGECLTVKMEGLSPDTILNRGHWMLPLGSQFVKVGATHVPGRRDLALTAEARLTLQGCISQMSLLPFEIVRQEAGVRAYVPDKKPVVGRHPSDSGLGICGGLGAKGTLFAPAVAQEWIKHLTEGAAFDPELDVARFWRAARLVTP